MVVMQPAQHVTNNFQIFVLQIAQNQGVFHQKCNTGPFIKNFFVDFLANNRDYDKFSLNNRLKKAVLGTFHEKGIFGLF